MDNIKIIKIEWEYRTEKGLNTDALNLLGKDGWELVSVIPAVNNNMFPDGPVYVFKRPVYPPID